MRSIKEIIITYLALYGFVVIAPFFLVLVSIPALIVGALLQRIGLSDDIATIGSGITVFLSIYVFGQIYAAVRFRKMEKDAERASAAQD